MENVGGGDGGKMVSLLFPLFWKRVTEMHFICMLCNWLGRDRSNLVLLQYMELFASILMFYVI